MVRFRRAGDVPLYRLADLPENVVGRVLGHVELHEARWLEAPLSRRRCVYYEVAVDQHVLLHGLVRELASERRGVPFALTDDGHRAIVEPEHATIRAAFDDIAECAGTFDAPPRERELLDHLGLVRRDWFWTQGLRFREAVLEVGERIAVTGAGTREPDPSAHAVDGLYRDARPTRYRIAGTARHPIAITDDPGVACDTRGTRRARREPR